LQGVRGRAAPPTGSARGSARSQIIIQAIESREREERSLLAFRPN
jgi:hypothetical protein